MRSSDPNDLDADSVAAVGHPPVAAWSTPSLIGVLLAAAVVALAAFMNWGLVVGPTSRGIRGDRLLLLVLAVLVVVAAIVGRRAFWSAIACLLLGALVLMVVSRHLSFDADPGWPLGPGVFYTAVGGVGITLIGLVVSAGQARVEATERRFGQAPRTTLGPTGVALIGLGGFAVGALSAWWVG